MITDSQFSCSDYFTGVIDTGRAELASSVPWRLCWFGGANRKPGGLRGWKQLLWNCYRGDTCWND